MPPPRPAPEPPPGLQLAALTIAEKPVVPLLRKLMAAAQQMAAPVLQLAAPVATQPLRSGPPPPTPQVHLPPEPPPLPPVWSSANEQPILGECPEVALTCGEHAWTHLVPENVKAGYTVSWAGTAQAPPADAAVVIVLHPTDDPFCYLDDGVNKKRTRFMKWSISPMKKFLLVGINHHAQPTKLARWKLPPPTWVVAFACQIRSQCPGSRIHLCGGSRGAYWGHALLSLMPHLFHTAVLVAGYPTPGCSTGQQAKEGKDLANSSTNITWIHSQSDICSPWHQYEIFFGQIRSKIPILLLSDVSHGDCLRFFFQGAIEESDPGASLRKDQLHEVWRPAFQDLQ